jgi:PAS domain S-box-containing protein
MSIKSLSSENILKLSKISLLTIKEDCSIIAADYSAIDIFELTGIYDEPEELEKKKLCSILGLAVDARAELIKMFSTMQLNKLESRDFTINTLKGDEKQLQISFLKVESEDNEKLIKVLVKDVTDIKASEKMLSSLNLMYKTIINIAPIGILLVDNNGIIREFNNYLANMMGAQSSADFLKKNIFTIIGLEEINFLSEIRFVIRSKRPAAGEKKYISNYGKTVYFSYILVPVPVQTTDDDQVSVFGIIEDQTKIKELTGQDNIKR